MELYCEPDMAFDHRDQKLYPVLETLKISKTREKFLHRISFVPSLFSAAIDPFRALVFSLVVDNLTTTSSMLLMPLWKIDDSPAATVEHEPPIVLVICQASYK